MSFVEPRDPPQFNDLIGELTLIRRTGIIELRKLDLPALALAAGFVSATDRAIEAPQIEGLLRHGIDALDGGRLADSAGLLFGLEPGTRADTPTQLREDAAERWGVSVSQYRHRWEPLVVEQLAESILRLCDEHNLRMARLAMERRTPASTRLAISWIERFESMYRLWTPLYALGADLTAYRSSHLRSSVTSQVRSDDQAAGYVAFSLHHFARYLAESRRFEQRFGGLWLLSDEQAEQDLADAVYRVGWHSPNNERDDSYLRDLLDRADEAHPFLDSIDQDRIGADILAEWRRWAAACSCEWTTGGAERGFFPTSEGHRSIDPRCALHSMVDACNDFCLILDDDWRRIADWYHISTDRPTGVSASQLIAKSRLE